MRVNTRFLFLALPLTACINDLGSRPLYGTWGGAAGSVVATSGGMSISTACGAVASTNRVVHVDGSGRFSIQGELRGFDNSFRDTLPLPPVRPALISGSVTGDQIMASIQFMAGVHADTLVFDGRRGQPPGEPVICG